MSFSWKRIDRVSRSLVVVFAVLLAMTVSVGRAGIASAQDATPEVGECVAPALPPGTPSPNTGDTAEGEDMAGMDHGTPAAEEEAPVEEEAPAPAGTPADEATTSDVQAGAQNIVNCLMGGNLEGTAALLTTEFIQDYFGMATPYDVLATDALEDAPYHDVQTGEVLTYEDGSVSVELTRATTPYQVSAERWTMVQEDGYWKLLSIEEHQAPAPEGDTAVVGVNMTEYAFEPNVPSVVQMPVITFHLINAGTEEHEMVLLRLPEGKTFDEVMADPALQDATEEIGFGFAAPGEQTDVALVGLEPGVYTMICFVTSPDGVEHVEKGMVAEFEITAPAS